MAMQRPEALATHLGWDVSDVKDCRYQQHSYSFPIYVIGEDYMTTCKVGKKPGKFDGRKWHKVESWITEKYGYEVYIAYCNELIED